MKTVRFFRILCVVFGTLLWYGTATAQSCTTSYDVTGLTGGPTLPTSPVCIGSTWIYTMSYTTTSTTPGFTPSYQWFVTGGTYTTNDAATIGYVTWTDGPVHEVYVKILDQTCTLLGHCSYVCHKSNVMSVVTYTATITAPNGLTACIPPTSGVVLNASTDLTIPAYTFTWMKGATVVGTGSSYTATVAGTYTVYASKGAVCKSATSNPKTVTINVGPTGPSPYAVQFPDGTSYCEGASGLRVRLTGSESGVTYTLSGAVSGNGAPTTLSPPEWINVTAADTSSNIAVFGTKGGCSILVGGGKFTKVAVPTAYTVRGNGNICPPPSAETVNNGVSITLDSSKTNVQYFLKRNGSTVLTAYGNGNPFAFPSQTVPGTYTVTAKTGNVYCTFETAMSGSVVVQNLQQETAYPLTGQNYCTGTVGGAIELGGSTLNSKYQLYKESVPYGDPLTGTGDSLKWFTLPPGGHYTVIATGPNCPKIMTGEFTINKMTPIKYLVSGGGTICDEGKTISLSNSELGVNYSLIKNDVAVAGSSKAGNDSTLHWTNITDVGKYKVIATNTSVGSCSNTMTGSAKISNGPEIDIRVSRYPCIYHFSPVISRLGSCGITSILWDFGDGTSSDPDPFHDFASGTHTITLTVTSSCDGVVCIRTDTTELTVAPYEFENVTVMDTTYTLEKIINTSASTFSDAWPLPFELAHDSDMNPFLSGQRGVWRNEGQYAYKATRSQSTPVNLATDGTFSMDFFDWKKSGLNAIPNWIKANTVTRYSSYSYELENKDVMDIYSSALYDYSGQLVTAQGSNMRNNEMAFSSFETDINASVTGNLTFGSPASQKVKFVRVVFGYGNMAIVDAKFSQFSDITQVDVGATTLEQHYNYITMLTEYTWNKIVKDPIVCKMEYATNNDYTVIVLNEAPFWGLWQGNVVIRRSSPGIVAVKDDQVTHTGKGSLKVTGTKIFPQPQLELDSAKAYFISAWAAIGNNTSYLKPYFRDSLGTGLIVTIKDEEGTVKMTDTLYAAGPIIEGWQQVKGTFTVPISNSQFEIGFLAGLQPTDTTWFDDLRVHPDKGVMKSFVYDLVDYRLIAILDEQNFASLFYYDSEGNLFLTKKDTERGRKAISENVSYIKKTGQ